MLAAYQECRFPRCPNYAVHRGYCHVHAASPHGDERQPSDPLTSSAHRRFRRVRIWFLRQHPVCNVCREAPASVLDHIVPHRGNRDLFWAETNWQALCDPCHRLKTAGEVARRVGRARVFPATLRK